MYDSENRFKERLPDFLDKSEDSNLSKMVKVINHPLIMLRQKIDELTYYNKLYRPILIKRVQNEPKKCLHTIIVDIEDIKEVNVYCNGAWVSGVSFDYEEHVNSWEETFDDVSEDIIVPYIYRAVVKTYNEFIYTAEDKVYDKSIDVLGVFLNCPRISFKDDILESEYPYTYPAYNFDSQEPDWYYLARMKEYVSLMDGMPSACLHVWSNYLTLPKYENRKDLIAKIGEYTAYPEEKTDAIFIRVSQNNPMVGASVLVESYSIDSEIHYSKVKNAIFSRQDEEDYKCIGYDSVYLKIKDNKDISVCSVSYTPNEDLPPLGSAIPTDINRSYSKTTLIAPVPYDYGDYYVSPSGSDDNNGMTEKTAFKTLEKAVSVLQDEDIVILLDGAYELSNDIVLTHDCYIHGKKGSNVVIDCKNYKVMVSNNNRNVVSLNDLTFTKNSEDYKFTQFTIYDNRSLTSKLKIIG